MAHCHKTAEKIQGEARSHILINDYKIAPPLINNQPNLSTLKNMELLREKIRLKDTR